jgi:hypothetical protein
MEVQSVRGAKFHICLELCDFGRLSHLSELERTKETHA